MQSIILPPLGGQFLPRSPRPGSLLYVVLGFASGYCWHMVLLPPFQALGPLTQMPPGAQEGGDSSVISRTFLSSSPFPFPHQEKNGGGGDMGPTPLFLQRNIFFPSVLSHKVCPRGRQHSQSKNIFCKEQRVSSTGCSHCCRCPVCVRVEESRTT